MTIRITYPVAIEINEEDIAEGAKCCNMSQDEYRKGIVEDRLECLKYHLEDSSFVVDDARIEME